MRITVLTILLLLNLSLRLQAEEGLVAWYKLDEGIGEVAGDSGGMGNNGKVSRAEWVKVPGGHALRFDGKRACVDCGLPAALDLRGEMTLAAWVCPDWAQTAQEPGIIGKGYSSYGITLFLNRLYFYIGDGTNNLNRGIPVGLWAHIAVTFDGKYMRTFVNGEMIARKVSKLPSAGQGGVFYIGRRDGDYFKGMVDDVRVYSRALDESEIAALYASDSHDRNNMFAEKHSPVVSGQKISDGTITVTVGRDGGMSVSRGGGDFALASRYSCPGDVIEWNSLSKKVSSSNWEPRVSRVDSRTLRVEAVCRQYSLRRTIRLNAGRVELEDTFTNIGESPIGIMLRHSITTPEIMTGARAGSTPDNPVLFFGQPAADFGLVAEDDIGRLQFRSTCIANSADIRHDNFALDAGKSYTFRYAVYPLKPTGDVYEFINRVRSDWGVNFTVEGPWKFMHAADPKFKDPAVLKQYLERMNLRIVAIMPWLDYDPGAITDHVLSREEYTSMIGGAVKALKHARPEIKVIGCIENDWLTIYPEKIKNGDRLLTGAPEEVARIINDANLPCADSIKRDKNGHVKLEIYERMGKTLVALGVYPAPGNFQHRFLMEQARFLVEEVGLDGVYIDEFSQALPEFHIPHSYTGWDGLSADIDPETGCVSSFYVDCGLAGIAPRVEIMEYVLGEGKNLTANTYSSSGREQSIPAQRFWEMQSYLSVDALRPGKKPPFVYQMSMGLLGSPIGLGAIEDPEKPGAEGLMLAIISYLRHGLLYYHYSYPDLPAAGPGSGDYGPINRMFPFTPVELHEGWVKGKERILTAVPCETEWSGQKKPSVFCFNLEGKEVPSQEKASITGVPGKWRISLRPEPWSEVLVVE